MTEVTQELWTSLLGNMPKPEGATVEMMWAAHDSIRESDDRDEDMKLLQWYQDSRAKYEEKIAFWKTKTDEPNYHERLKLLESNIKSIDEGIELFRERLLG